MKRNNNRICLLTIWHVGNYGAELQTYCTVKCLQRFGSVKVIDFRLTDLDRSMSNNILRKVVWYIIGNWNLAKIKNSIFWKKYIPTTKRYKSLEELTSNPPLGDYYFVGSDQVWNTVITREYAPAFFLNFAPSKSIRASYASSFGANSWNGNEYISEIAKRNLDNFSKISCRESSGVSILKNQFGVNGVNVLDPTLLFDNYDELTGEIHTNDTLAYYPLSKNDGLTMFCEKLAKQMGLVVVNANKKTIIANRYLWNRRSISQWLRIMGSAKFVVTPSFHGLTTSIIQHRQFIVVVTEELILERCSRIVDLLSLLDLNDRFFTSYEEAWESKIWEKEIDYRKVDNKLTKLRKQSFEFIKSVFVE